MTQRAGALDLEVSDELIQFCEIDTRAKPTRLRMNAEPPWTPGGRRSDSQPVSECLVDDLLERAPALPSHRLQFIRKVIVQRERGAHSGIVLPAAGSVKMPA